MDGSGWDNGFLDIKVIKKKASVVQESWNTHLLLVDGKRLKVRRLEALTEQQQFDILGRLNPILFEILLDLLAPGQGSPLFGTHSATHGSTRWLPATRSNARTHTHTGEGVEKNMQGKHTGDF